MPNIQGSYCAHHHRIAIIASQFNDIIVRSLIQGACETLEKAGFSSDSYDIIRGPGAWELPILAAKAATTKQYQGIIALGCLIQGATPHFEHISAQCSAGLMNISLKYEIPLTMGVLTTNTLEHALERAGSKAGNKGCEAALALVETLDVIQKMAL